MVTGTLPAGAVSRGDELLVTPALRPVRVRATAVARRGAAALAGVARAALNLRGVDRADVRRGMALVQARPVDPGQADRRADRHWLAGPARTATLQPPTITVHVGSARTPAKVRMLGAGLARLRLRDPLPLHVGDRVLLRDPGAAGQGAPGRTGRCR